MGCLLGAFLLVLGPRVMGAFIFLLTDWWGKAYDSIALAILGFIFLPWTALAYMCAVLNSADGTVSGGWILLVILGVVFDLCGDCSLSSDDD